MNNSNKKMIESFTKAAMTSVQDVIGINQIIMGNLFLLSPGTNLAAQVTGWVDLVHEDFSATVMISFPERTLRKMFIQPSMDIQKNEGNQLRAKEILEFIWDRTRELMDPENCLLTHVDMGILQGEIKMNSDSTSSMILPLRTQFGEFYIIFSIKSESINFAAA